MKSILNKVRKPTTRQIISTLLMTVTLAAPVTIGNYTAGYGEIQLCGKHAEVNMLSTGQGFITRNCGYHEGIDYIIITNNRGTEDPDDDRLVKLIPVV